MSKPIKETPILTGKESTDIKADFLAAKSWENRISKEELNRIKDALHYFTLKEGKGKV